MTVGMGMEDDEHHRIKWRTLERDDNRCRAGERRRER